MSEREQKTAVQLALSLSLEMARVLLLKSVYKTRCAV